MLSAFSSKASAGELCIVDKLEMDEYKTKNGCRYAQCVGRQHKDPDRIGRKERKVHRQRSNIAGVTTALYNHNQRV